MTKTDARAADRLLTKAVRQATAMIRDGHERTDYTRVLEAAVIGAGVLMGEVAS